MMSTYIEPLLRGQLPSGLFTLRPDDFSEQGNFPMESQMQQYVWTICDGFCCVSDAGIQLTSSPHSLRILQLNQSLNSCRSRPCRSRTYHFSSVSIAGADGMIRTSLGASNPDVTPFFHVWMDALVKRWRFISTLLCKLCDLQTNSITHLSLSDIQPQ